MNDSEQEFRSLSDEGREQVLEQDRQLAKDLGLEWPYVSPQLFGSCPGGGSYGQGMSYTTVHLNCCGKWNERQALRQLADKEAGQ
jgi:hypothetical protein